MGCPGEGVGEWINGLVVTHLERTVLGGPNPFSGGVWMSRVSRWQGDQPNSLIVPFVLQVAMNSGSMTYL